MVCHFFLKVSNGWLNNFKRHHGIHHFSVQDERLSSDTNSAVVDFKRFVEDNRYTKSNADESGHNWRALPQKRWYAVTRIPRQNVKLIKIKFYQCFVLMHQAHTTFPFSLTENTKNREERGGTVGRVSDC